jgi:antitoxin VapB
VSPNIKDPEAHKLAQQLAEATGETMTNVVTEALREKLLRVRKKQTKRLTVEEMLVIGKKIRSQIKGPIINHAELLYDEKGLPK